MDRKKQRTMIFIVIVFFSIIMIGLGYWGRKFLTINQVVINEICAGNFSLIKSPEGNYCDYIELYNRGKEALVLDDYYLSDDADNLEKYSLKGLVISPGGYQVIWLEEITDSSEENHNFRISKEGEEIFLYDAKKAAVIDGINVPKLKYNLCYGRTKDGGSEWKQLEATAGESNNEANAIPQIRMEKPIFSVESGFYEEPFELKMQASIGEKIYYTLDGSEPTLDSLRYTEPIIIEDASGQENVYAARTDVSPTRDYVPDYKVDKATIVKARCISADGEWVSETATAVYFVGYDRRTEYTGFPVISLITEPGNLLDNDYGIYVNGKTLEKYKADGGLQDGQLLSYFTDAEGNARNLYLATNACQEGKEWEREAVLTYFDEEHEYLFEQGVGIRIAGASTRATPQKSLSIYGRNIYDERKNFPIDFYNNNIERSTFKLRNGGNKNDAEKITDAFLESMVEDRSVTIQRSKPCILFLNGEYWGIYNIRERYNEEYISNYFKIAEDNIWMMDGKSAKTGGREAQDAYDFFCTLAEECDLSYEDVYAMVSAYVDIQSLIDFCCINMYIDNRDLSFEQNCALWRSKEVDETVEAADGKWRWMIFDQDESLNDYTDLIPGQWLQDYCLMQEPVVQSFMKNEAFRRQFCISMMDIANVNFSYEQVHEKLTEWQKLYREQLVKNQHRFFNDDFTEAAFDRYIEEIDSFFENRFSFVMEALAGYFELDGTLEEVKIRCDSEGGNVYINTSQITGQNEWSGFYYTDYPITLTAESAEGYRFAGWSGDISSDETQIETELLMGGLNIYAKFEKID